MSGEVVKNAAPSGTESFAGELETRSGLCRNQLKAQRCPSDILQVGVWPNLTGGEDGEGEVEG